MDEQIINKLSDKYSSLMRGCDSMKSEIGKSTMIGEINGFLSGIAIIYDLEIDEVKKILWNRGGKQKNLQYAANCALWLLNQQELAFLFDENQNWGDPEAIKRLLEEAGCVPSCEEIK